MPLSAPEPLAESHELSDFRCGVESLDTWLKRRARANQISGASRVFVVAESGRVVAYYALASGAIAAASALGRFRRTMPDPLPVVLLARLAVDHRWQGKQLGRALFRDAASRVCHAADSIGIRGIITHALSDQTRAFYLALGFEPSPFDPLTLMVTLPDVRAILDPSLSRETYMPLDHAAAFARAWDDPRHTRFELPPVDINAVLAAHYRCAAPVRFTREMLWDVEVRKAWRPDLYIPSTVREGSAATWARAPQADGSEAFLRGSRQRRWLAPERDGLVLEQVRIDPIRQTVLFIGAAETPDRDGKPLPADRDQALFHVEHSVDGGDTQPLNRWRIVHLTEQPDERLIAPLVARVKQGWLPEFVEIYIRDRLKIGLTRL